MDTPGIDELERERLKEPGYGAAPSGNGRGGPGILMRDVHRECVRWLWASRIPFGKVTLLEGDPDEGKSSLVLDLAARVSTGSLMPFDATRREPAGVVILSAEDGLGDTIRPRLEAAGADLDRILGFRFDELPEIPAGLDVIEAAVMRVSATLVVVDPVMAFLADHVESHRDHHIRRALAPLAGLAQRTGVAMTAIRHLNKSGGSNAKYRGGGSIGITGAARSVMLAAPDPDDATRKILARVKGNLAPPYPAIAYRLVPAGETVRIEWIEETAHTANGLLAVSIGDDQGEERSALDEAKRLLRDQLAAGPVEAKKIKAELTAAGVAPRTLDRAKAALGVRASKSDFDGPWVWSLPTRDIPKSAKNAEERQGGEVASFGGAWRPSTSNADDEVAV